MGFLKLIVVTKRLGSDNAPKTHCLTRDLPLVLLVTSLSPRPYEPALS